MRIIKGVKPRRFKKYTHWYNKIGVDDIRVLAVDNRYSKKGLLSKEYSHTEITFLIGCRLYNFNSKNPDLGFIFESDEYNGDRKKECLNHFHSLLKDAGLK